MDINNALKMTGTGPFTYRLLIVCFFGLMAVALEQIISSFILPIAQCEMQIHSSNVDLINVALLIGGIVSSVLWGLLSDTIGRRTILIPTLLLNWMMSICCAFSNSYELFLLCRFMNGFFISAPATILYCYVAEFHPHERKTTHVSILGVFFVTALLLLPAAAWIILPLQLSVHLTWMNLTSWRLYIILFSFSSLIAAIGVYLLPESPKYLYSKGKKYEALKIMIIMFKQNTKKSGSAFPGREMMLNFPLDASSEDQNLCLNFLRVTENKCFVLFSSPWGGTLVLLTYAMFANMVGYFGLGWWLPDIYSSVMDYAKEYPTKIPIISNLEIRKPIDLANFEGPRDFKCRQLVDSAKLVATIVMVTYSWCANLIAICFSKYWHFGIIAAFTMIIGGISSTIILCLNSSVQQLVNAGIFEASMSITNLLLINIVIDIYPTTISGTAFSIMYLAGNIGTILFNLMMGTLLNIYCGIPLVAVCVILISGAIACYYLPRSNTKRNLVLKPETPQSTFRADSDLEDDFFDDFERISLNAIPPSSEHDEENFEIDNENEEPTDVNELPDIYKISICSTPPEEDPPTYREYM